MNPPPDRIVIRVEQMDAAQVADPPIPGGPAMYRLVGSQMSVCARHLAELGQYLPNAEARAVLTLDQIEALVVEFGLRRADLVAAHGPWDPIFGEERCQMCETLGSLGNVCHDDSCARPLHPRWPAVYCSDDCAMRDR